MPAEVSSEGMSISIPSFFLLVFLLPDFFRDRKEGEVSVFRFLEKLFFRAGYASGHVSWVGEEDNF